MKKWYQSKTILGILIAFVGFVVREYFKVDLEIPQNADYDTLMKHVEMFQAAKSDTVSIISEIMATTGTLIAIYGRFKAEEKLTK
jgi:hypothetical protein